MSNEINDLLKKLDERMDQQENMMQQLIQMGAQNNQRFNDMDKRFDSVDQRLERIEETVNRIEHNEPADIMVMLKQINGKLDERDLEIHALNKRLFKTETEIERLTRQ